MSRDQKNHHSDWDRNDEVDPELTATGRGSVVHTEDARHEGKRDEDERQDRKPRDVCGFRERAATVNQLDE